jgi:hypothetical protein
MELKVERLDKGMAEAVQVIGDDDQKKAMRALLYHVLHGLTWREDGDNKFPGRFVGQVILDKVDKDYSWVLMERTERGYVAINCMTGYLNDGEAEAALRRAVDRVLDEEL